MLRKSQLHFWASEIGIISLSTAANWQWGIPGPVWIIIALVAVVVALKTWPTEKSRSDIGNCSPTSERSLSADELIELERWRAQKTENLRNLIDGLGPVLMYAIFALIFIVGMITSIWL